MARVLAWPRRRFPFAPGPLWVCRWAMLTPPPEVHVKMSISASATDMRRLDDLSAGFGRLGLRVRRGAVLRALLELASEREMVLRTLIAEETAFLDADAEGGVEVYPTTDVPPRLIEKLDRVVDELARQGCRRKRAGVVRAVLASIPPAERWPGVMRRFLAEHPRRRRRGRGGDA